MGGVEGLFQQSCEGCVPAGSSLSAAGPRGRRGRGVLLALARRRWRLARCLRPKSPGRRRFPRLAGDGPDSCLVSQSASVHTCSWWAHPSLVASLQFPQVAPSSHFGK